MVKISSENSVFCSLLYFLFLGYQNGLNVVEPVAGASGISGLSSSDGGSLAGNGPNDAEGPPPDLPPLPMPRCGSYCSLSFASVIKCLRNLDR